MLRAEAPWDHYGVSAAHPIRERPPGSQSGGAEGAISPESLRQTNRSGQATLESGNGVNPNPTEGESGGVREALRSPTAGEAIEPPRRKP